MRIALIGGVTVPKNGGLESYMFELSKAMQNRGHEVWLICQGPNDDENVIDGLRITQLASTRGFFGIMKFLKKATNMVVNNEKKFDVINYHRVYFTKWLVKEARKKGIKTCYTNHSFAADNPKHGKITRLFLKTLNYTAFHNVNNYITVSEYGASLLKKRYGNDSFVLHGGVDVTNEHESDTYMQEYGLNDGKYYLTICRIDPVKGLEALIDAFMMHPKTDDVQLAIGGDVDNEYGQSLVERARGDERIVFLGRVYGNDKVALLNHTLAYCLVSSSEGFPIALLEAMAHGNACIVSDIPANREAIVEQDGYWCKTGNAQTIYDMMCSIEANPAKRKVTGNNNRNRVLSNFTWPIIAEQFETYLHELK